MTNVLHFTLLIVLVKAKVDNTGKQMYIWLPAFTGVLAKAKLNNKINLMHSHTWPPVYTPFIFLSSLFVFCRLCFVRMPQLIMHVLDKSISCHNVTIIKRL